MKKKTTPKKAVKKATPKKKTATKKAVKKVTKKVVKKTVAKKTVAKKTTSKKAPLKAKKKVVKKAAATTKKTAAKKVSSKKGAPTKKADVKKSSARKVPAKTAPATEPETGKTRPSQARILLARKNRAQTPAFVRVRTRKNTPIVFSLEEVHGILEKRKNDPNKKELTSKSATKKILEKTATQKKKRVLGAASLTDILGFNPKKAKDRKALDESRVPKKLLPHYRNLIKLRDHVQEGLNLHTKETLKRSAKEDVGDLSSYSQHMADAGTDTFDRDFALSTISNEQGLLYEIEEAIQRIFDGSYGICLNTGKPIPRERLVAVPFTRYSLEGQREQERFKHKKADRGGIFGDLSGEDSVLYGDEGAEE